MTIRPLMYIFIFLACAMFAMCMPFWIYDDFLKTIDDGSREFYDRLTTIIPCLYLLIIIVFISMPIASITAIKDLPSEIQSDELCIDIKKGLWACFWANVVVTALAFIVIFLLLFIFYGFFPNLIQICLSIVLYGAYRQRSLCYALITQFFMILIIVFSLILLNQIESYHFLWEIHNWPN